MRLEDDDADLAGAYALAQDQSRQAKGSLFWVAPLGDAVFAGLQDLHRSSEMISRHERQVSSAEEGKLLSDEKNRKSKLLQRLRNDLSAAFLDGRLFFEGREYRARDQGADIGAVAAALFAEVVPHLYAKFALAAVSVKGDETKQLLGSAALAGLPSLLYDGDGGLGLVRTVQGGPQLDPTAPAAQEMRNFIAGKDAYGESATGKLLESHFGAPPYGWEADVVVLVAAALFRAGAVELTSQGRTYRAWTDPAAQATLTAIPRFRAAEFRPREGPKLDDLVGALEGLRDLYGEEPELDVPALAKAARTRLSAETPGLVGLAERLRAHQLPGWDEVDELRRKLQGLVASGDDDLVKSFARDRAAIAAGLAEAMARNVATSEANLATLAAARQAVNQQWPQLRARGDVPGVVEAAAERLCADLVSDTWAERLSQIATDTATIRVVYAELHQEALARRDEAFAKSLRDLEARDEYAKLPEEVRQRIAAPLRERTGGTHDGKAPDLTTLVADLRLLPELTSDALVETERLVAPEARVERVRAAHFFSGAVATPEELDVPLAALRDHCAKLLAEGARVVLE